MCFADHYGFLLQDHLPKKPKKVKPSHVIVWSITVKSYQSIVVVWNVSSKFVFIERRTSNSECPDCQGCGKIGIWLARLSICWHRVMSSPIVMRVIRNFIEGLHFIAVNQIFLRNSFFSNTNTHRFLYSLLINWMFTCESCLLLAFDFIAKRNWRKLCSKAINCIPFFIKTLHEFL